MAKLLTNVFIPQASFVLISCSSLGSLLHGIITATELSGKAFDQKSSHCRVVPRIIPQQVPLNEILGLYPSAFYRAINFCCIFVSIVYMLANEIIPLSIFLAVLLLYHKSESFLISKEFLLSFTSYPELLCRFS